MSIPQEIDGVPTWQLLCESFSSDPAIWAAVQGAVQAELDGTGGASPWATLIDRLEESRRLLLMEPTSSSVDLVDDLATLPLIAHVDLGQVAAQTVPLVFAVPRANAILARYYFQLLYLEDDGIDYPLALVSTEAAVRIQQLAARVGHVARVIDEIDTTAAYARGEQGYPAALPYVAPPFTGPRRVNFGKRLLAFVIDLVVVYGVGIAAVTVASLAGDVVGDYDTVVGSAILLGFALYFVAMVVVVGRFGQSLGMLALGLKVVRIDTGGVPGFATALGRNILVALLPISIWALVAFITTLADESGRGLIDKAARTLMIDKRHPHLAPAAV